MPHASPSFRLLTSPAWLAADMAFSLKLVSTNTWRVDQAAVGLGGGIDVGAGLVAGMAVGLPDERGRQAEPQPVKAIPRKNGSGRRP